MFTNEGHSNGASADLSPDSIFTLLSDRRRRYLLYCLFRYANPVSLPRIADWVTEWELNASADEVPTERLHIYLELYHHHVPKLREADVVEYSQAEDLVELGAAADSLEPHLEYAAEHDSVASEWAEAPESTDDSAPSSE